MTDPVTERNLGLGGAITDLSASTRELHQLGRELRRTLRRRDHGTLTLPERDPVAILEEQNSTRVPELVPVRMGRMLQSPFAYFRGTAGTMAHDLAADPVTGFEVVCCGDAHIANFGMYASPERRLLFDLNDFDEASNAPWEWDVKRFATSVVVGGRDNGFSDKDCRDMAESAVRSYRTMLHELFELTALERYYFQLDTELLEKRAKEHAQLIRKTEQKARSRTSDQALDKLAVTSEDGDPLAMRIKDDPPVTTHSDLVTQEALVDGFGQYARTLRADTYVLLSQFTIVDCVVRVVGVGSVGTRCLIALLVGPSGEPLFLQAKEVAPSVLETYGGRPCRFDRLREVAQGRESFRVVAGQRILQAHSDPFLGWVGRWTDEREGILQRDFFFRQFRDMKGSVDTSTLNESQYGAYVDLCAQLLARAHSQSPGASLIGAYLSDSDHFDRAVAGWSMAYADQTERDFATLEAAARTGRVPATRGV